MEVRACLHGGSVPRLTGLPGYPSYPWRPNFSYVSLENASKRLHARQGSPPTRGTLSTCPRHPAIGGVAFYHVNGSCQAIRANRGEINRENMAARGEFFRSCHLPVLSAEQNDRQSEEINVTDELLSDRSRDKSRSQLTVPFG